MNNPKNYYFLDTSFVIRLLNADDDLHPNVLSFFKHITEHGHICLMSTIAIAEYCVKGNIRELPLKICRVLPFNIDHAIRAGDLAAIIHKMKHNLELKDRKIISNDTKLFAQADTDIHVTHFATTDAESLKIFNALRQSVPLKFQMVNLREPWQPQFGELPF